MKVEFTLAAELAAASTTLEPLWWVVHFNVRFKVMFTPGG